MTVADRQGSGPVSAEESRAAYAGLREAVEQLERDDLDSTQDAPAVTDAEAARVLATHAQRHTYQPRTGLVAVTVLALALLGCAALTPGEKTAIEAGTTVACAALSFVPLVGGALASACAGEEKNLEGALDAAGTPVAPVAAPIVVSPQTLASVRKPVHRRGARGQRIHMGNVPAISVAACQAYADKLPAIDVLPVVLPQAPAALPLADAGAPDASAEGGAR